MKKQGTDKKVETVGNFKCAYLDSFFLDGNQWEWCDGCVDREMKIVFEIQFLYPQVAFFSQKQLGKPAGRL